MASITEQEMEKEVINYLMNVKDEVGKEEFSKLSIWAVKATDIIKLIERPTETHRWPSDFFDSAVRAIEKTYKHCVLKEPLNFDNE